MWPLTTVQTCIIHLIRNTFHLASKRDWDALRRDVKPICTAVNAAAARAALDEMTGKWGQRYPAIIRLWHNAWEQFIPFLDYDVEIRQLLCSTDAIESLNARYRRAVKARGHFPAEQAALKCLYLVTRSLDPTGRGKARWAMRWKPVLNAFAITFGDRFPAAERRLLPQMPETPFVRQTPAIRIGSLNSARSRYVIGPEPGVSAHSRRSEWLRNPLCSPSEVCRTGHPGQDLPLLRRSHHSCRWTTRRHLCLPARNRATALSMRRCRVSALLAAVMLLNVIPLHAVGELAEECAGLLIGRQRGGEVGRDGHLPWHVCDGQGHADGVFAFQPGGVADGGADADHVLAAHHGDRVPVFVTVDVNEHGRALAGRELLDDLVRYHDSGVVAAGGNGCLERHTRRFGCHRPLHLSPPDQPAAEVGS